MKKTTYMPAIKWPISQDLINKEKLKLPNNNPIIDPEEGLEETPNYIVDLLRG